MFVYFVNQSSVINLIYSKQLIFYNKYSDKSFYYCNRDLWKLIYCDLNVMVRLKHSTKKIFLVYKLGLLLLLVYVVMNRAKHQIPTPHTKILFTAVMFIMGAKSQLFVTVKSFSHKPIIYMYLQSLPLVAPLKFLPQTGDQDSSVQPGNNKGGSIIVPLTSCFTGLDQSVLQIKTKIVSCHTAYSKPVKQEVNGTVILPPLVNPGSTLAIAWL